MWHPDHVISYRSREFQVCVGLDSGGYDLSRFCASESQLCQSGLTCSICSQVLRDPVSTIACEHVFCRSCLREWRENANTCPLCRVQMYSLFVPQIDIRRKVERLHVRCHLSSKCYSTSRLGEGLWWQRHEQQCKYRSIECHGCRNRVRVRDLPVHDRLLCPSTHFMCVCGESVERAAEALHICTKLERHCLNGCRDVSGQLLRFSEAEFNRHNVHCYRVACPMAKFGCTFRGSHVQLGDHVKNGAEEHVRLIVQSHNALQERYSQAQQRWGEYARILRDKHGIVLNNLEQENERGLVWNSSPPKQLFGRMKLENAEIIKLAQ